jgi:ectoine hydroxylase-related dioxygenase (phytanoyl-CoA dioxygenase family)
MIRLTDKQMRDFVVNGYVTVKTDLPAAHHQGVCRQLDEMFDEVGNSGNNLLPLIPEIQAVFDDPAVNGALTSVLGENYLMHPHRYCHTNRPGSNGQDAHKDTYEGDEQVKRHRCRWTLAFYYPQNTTADMGPSAVLPGTQYYETVEAARSHPERSLCGEAGTVVIAHYDLWHRATPNASANKRYMLKFLFTRLDEPKRPAWNSTGVEWQPPNGEGFPVTQGALWRRLWDWNRGVEAACGSSPNATASSQLIADLGESDETVGLDAAYSLAGRGDADIGALIDCLRHGSDLAGRHAAHALGAAGASAASVLAEALRDRDSRVRIGAAYALGDVAPGAEALLALTRALEDESAWVRRHSVEALGHMGDAAHESTPQIASLLQDEHEWVRDNAARALAKIGSAAEAAVPKLTAALQDKSRYVRFHAGVALREIDTIEARKVLFRDLMTSRWCPLTTSASPY